MRKNSRSQSQHLKNHAYELHTSSEIAPFRPARKKHPPPTHPKRSLQPLKLQLPNAISMTIPFYKPKFPQVPQDQAVNLCVSRASGPQQTAIPHGYHSPRESDEDAFALVLVRRDLRTAGAFKLAFGRIIVLVVRSLLSFCAMVV
jgi:hypothetical protein